MFDENRSRALTSESALLLGDLGNPVKGLSDKLKSLTGSDGSLLYSDGEKIYSAYFVKSSDSR